MNKFNIGDIVVVIKMPKGDDLDFLNGIVGEIGEIGERYTEIRMAEPGTGRIVEWWADKVR